jgi:hypothetical protein
MGTILRRGGEEAHFFVPGHRYGQQSCGGAIPARFFRRHGGSVRRAKITNYKLQITTQPRALCI